MMPEQIVALVIVCTLAILPHLVAAFPSLTQSLGLVGGILNVLAGNYGAAQNAPLPPKS